MPPSDALTLAARFFAAIEDGDVYAIAALYHPTLRVWHSNDRLETTREANLLTLRRFIERTRCRRYADRRIEPTPSGFVQQHRVVAEGHNGAILDTSVCIVVTLADGLMARIDEYLDQRDLDRWFAAVAG